MIKKIAWPLFVLVVLVAFLKILPDDLNTAFADMKDQGTNVTTVLGEQADKHINPEEWSDLPQILPTPSASENTPTPAG